jgi:predicted ABC-type ATPase
MALFWTNIYEVWNYVNADLIAEGLSPFKPESVAIESGTVFHHSKA